jgi:hypothetical protein
MRREIIQDFLNVPGIAGLALMDGLSSPYFWGFELPHPAKFEPAQQKTVAQSIQQVLETTPEGFNSFEFQFGSHQVYLHKLNPGITLLVLTGNQVSRQTYTQAVRRLLIELQLSQADPIAEFRELASDIPLPSVVLSPVLSTAPLSTNCSGNCSELSVSEPKLEPRLEPKMELKPGNLASSSLPNSSNLPINLKDVLAAINELTQLTTQYLGTMVVSNYWKSTRPSIDWLNHFQIERSAQMTFSVQMPSERLPMLTAEQYRWLKAWVLAFIERCSQVIRDFAKIVRQALSRPQIALLFDIPD